MKKVLIVLGHPSKGSFCGGLAQSYRDGAIAAGAQVKTLNLGEIKFSPILHGGYLDRTELEPDLKEAQDLIIWSDHLVWVYPTWWAAAPALLKGFIDRVFLPGFAFDYVKGSPLPKKHLGGRTARLIVTMDSPIWYYKLFMGNAGHKMMKKGVLEFCGVKPVRVTAFAPIKNSTDKVRAQWKSKCENLGRRLV